MSQDSRRELRPVAFVTGASRGIGRGIALELARCGHDIVGNATGHERESRGAGLAQVQAEVEALGAAFEPAPGDIASLDVHQQLLDRALARFGRVDVLVNNAGVAPSPRRDILETTPDTLDRVLAVNTVGTFFLTQRFARQMVAQADRGGDETARRPTIVFITSVSAVTSSIDRVEYCMSKAATGQASQVFAERLARHGITVFEVRPGIIRTDMTEPVADRYDARIADGLVPQNRWGTPQDVGRAVAALARGDFGYSTGMVFEVSGGMSIRRL